MKERDSSNFKPRITFCYVSHGEASINIQTVIAKAKQADLILLEMVGMSPRERVALESDLNLVLKSENHRDPAGVQLRASIIRSMKDSRSFTEEFILGMAGSNKQLKFIDIDGYDPNYGESVLEDVQYMTILNHLYEGKLNAALSTYKRALDTSNRVHIYREGQVVNQVQTIAKSTKVKKILVIQGAAHTQTHHTFKKMHKSLYDTHFEYDRQQYTYGFTDQLMRQKRRAPGDPISEFAYKRSFLADIIFAQAVLLLHPDWPTEVMQDVAENLVHKLTPQEVDRAWSRFDELYQEKIKIVKHGGMTFKQVVQALWREMDH